MFDEKIQCRPADEVRFSPDVGRPQSQLEEQARNEALALMSSVSEFAQQQQHAPAAA